MQIGNAITEKKLLDVLLQARDRGLYHAITDCGAGGFQLGRRRDGREARAPSCRLDQAPLKYEGLSYTEIWISEAQERMVLAVPPDNWDALRSAVRRRRTSRRRSSARFEPTGRLQLLYHGRAGGRPGHELPARRPAAGGARGGM